MLPRYYTMDRPINHIFSRPAPTAQTVSFTASSPSKQNHSPPKVSPPESHKLIFRPHSIRLGHCHRIGHFPLLNPAARYRGINRRTYPSRKRRLRSSSRDSSHPRNKPRTRPSIATNRQLRRTSSGGISV